MHAARSIRAESHSEPNLDVGRRMMAFNWLPAAYAHADWLGPWAELLRHRDAVSTRILQRASVALIDRYDLRARYVRDAGSNHWLLHSHLAVTSIASALGTAMLGGWVRGRLERREVEQQQAVLGTAGRQEALRYSHELQALPFAPTAAGWPVSPSSPESVVKLGISCLVSLLNDSTDGARERFTLRFAHGHVTPLTLTTRQRDDAATLILAVENAPTLAAGAAA
jgi:YOP proteins translocation protein K (YscK)